MQYSGLPLIRPPMGPAKIGLIIGVATFQGFTHIFSRFKLLLLFDIGNHQ